ncbi:MAG: hypothetical protein RL595_240 [Planctomycetota bacterium]|jgi:hypothetical protein
MSANNPEDRWKSLADELGLPPDHSEPKLTPVQAVPSDQEPNTPVVFTPPVTHFPASNHEKVVITEETLEIIFAKPEPAKEQPLVVEARITEEPKVETVQETQHSGELVQEESNEGGERQDRGDRNQRGRGRRGRRGGNNRGRGRSNDNEQAVPEPEIVETSSHQHDEVAFSTGSSQRSDDDILFTSAAGEHINPEEHVHEEIADTHAPQPTAEEEEHFEEVHFGDWNVPSWNELIDSLYRPDR